MGAAEHTNPDAAITEPKLWRVVTAAKVTRDHTVSDSGVTAVIPARGSRGNGHTRTKITRDDHTDEFEVWAASLEGLDDDDDPPLGFLEEVVA